MRCYVKFSIDVDFLMEHVYAAATSQGVKLGRYWTQDGLLVLEAKQGVKLKLKLRPVSYKDTYFGIEVKSAVVDGWLKVGGDAIGLVMKICKKLVQRESPFAVIKTAGNIIYFENVLSQKAGVIGNSVYGELFYMADQI